MKLFKSRFTKVVIALLFLISTGYAADAGKTMDHSGHVGERIHESKVEGFSLAYHLLELPGKEDRHLMVYVFDAKGAPVADAKVGYLVVGPDGGKQKVMAMAMNDSFGGDVNFTAKGAYTVKTKILAGEKKLVDSFVYQVE